MSYQILARKYRPQVFDDVIGQETVTRTLKNSVLQGRVANAYIFCGPRGVGKTSIARLLSKMLNCKAPAEKSPCNECSSCNEITKGNNIDVLEIDGASNNGVDEIRTLRDNVKFSPTSSKYKIYIIDEVHMLSTGAFNALLKTLEEPPEHVKFIFATTESRKILPTIMSRCQRFDFKKISTKMILDRVNDIAQKEGIDVEEKAALLIARTSDGSLRDSLVILDQMISFSGKKILYDDVIELLGMVSGDSIFELSGAVIDSETRRVAEIIDELINNGIDPSFINSSLISHFRQLMILKTVGAPTSDMAFDAEELELLKKQYEKLPLDEILYILQNLTYCITLMKGTTFSRAPLEITLIKLTRRRYALSLPDILEKLEERTPSAVADNVPVKKDDSVEQVVARVEQVDEQEEELEIPAGGEAPGTDFSATTKPWNSILNYVRNKKMSVFTFLSNGKPVELNKDKVVIGFDKEHAFNKEALEANGRTLVEEAANRATGGTPRVEFTIMEFLGKDTDAEPEKDTTPQKKAEAMEKMKPVIEKAMDVFGGRVVQDVMEDNK